MVTLLITHNGIYLLAHYLKQIVDTIASVLPILLNSFASNFGSVIFHKTLPGSQILRYFFALCES